MATVKRGPNGSCTLQRKCKGCKVSQRIVESYFDDSPQVVYWCPTIGTYVDHVDITEGINGDSDW